MTSRTDTVQARPATPAAPEDHLAVAVDVAQVQKAASELAVVPEFTPATEPVRDGQTYAARDGVLYYHPTFRVAGRGPGLLPGPNVWFLRDDHGAVRLEWAVAEVAPPGAQAGAVPFPITVDAARLVWQGGEHAFGPAVVDAVDPPAAGGPAFLVRGGALLDPEEAATLETAMSGANLDCRLEIVYSFAYTVRTLVITKPGSFDEDPAPPRGEEVAMLRAGPAAVEDGPVRRPAPRPAGRPIAVPAGATPSGAMTPEMLKRLEKVRISELTGPKKVITTDRRSQTVRTWMPFYFNPDEEANRPIYRALHGVANLTDEWRQSAAGYLRDSGFPNTVYRIPDELRLAFDPDFGTPHVLPSLYKDAEGRAAVRVLMRVAPWQDPPKVLETRKLVGLPAAQVIVGPVPPATLRMGGSFPEQIEVIGGDLAVSIAAGAELLLDVSLESFQLLCGALGGAVGVPGTVEVTLSTPDGAEAAGVEGDDAAPVPTTVPVPVRLRMDRVDDLPVTVRPTAPDELSPTSVTLTNRSGTAIRIGGCEAVFLQMDDTSVVPLGSFDARCSTPFPIELAPGGTAELSFAPVDGQPEDFWTAVLVDLLDKTMVADAATTLRAVTELAGAGELSWDLTVSCPVLEAATVPERWSALVGIEVEVTAPGFEGTTVVLRRDPPRRTITLRKPLAELVAGGAAGIQTATFRVRNNYADHQGQWTAPQQQSGEELIVYPNTASGD